MEKKLVVLFEKYSGECLFSSGLRDETVRGYTHVFGYFQRLMPEIESPEQITEDVMRDFLRRAQTRSSCMQGGKTLRGLKNSSLLTYRNKLKPFFNWLVSNGHMDINPLLKIKSPKVRYTDSRALTKSDIEKLYTAIMLHSSSSLIRLRDACIVTLLFHTGLRRGELIGLQVSDINLERRRLRVRAETSKSDSERSLTISHELAQHMRDYVAERNRLGYKTSAFFVSSARDQGLTVHGYKHWVKRLMQKSGVKFHLHRFRHSFACALAKDNVQFVKIQRLMGHVDPQMTLQYMRSIQTDDCVQEMNNLSLDSLSR